LLAACGKAGAWLLGHAPLNQKLRLRESITTSAGKPVQSFLSGQRLVRQHGVAVKDPRGFHTSGINPETGLCVSKDGLHVKFIVADGWMSGSGGTGVTIADMGQLAAKLRCYSTIILDGGGSATMVSKRAGPLVVLNQMPKVIAQRPVPNGLFVVRG
jgi:exopolysaccharide biosynthesis protein